MVIPLRYVLLLLIGLQGGFWWHAKSITPDLGVVPDVPGKAAVAAFTFGDPQFFFRALAFNIQNAGDTYGRSTALRYYDFNKLYLWFLLLDELDPRSDMIPSIATYYFSQTQNQPDVRYIVDYLYEHATRDVEHKWWWLMQSIYLATHKLNDLDLALKVSEPLVHPKVPAFAQHMAAVVREQRGEMDAAIAIMDSIQKNAEQISDSDLVYMTYFIQERAETLDALEKQRRIEEYQHRLLEGTVGQPLTLN